jgi:dipeptidyl aminopeptidase/acylaminoacyl peptidase
VRTTLGLVSGYLNAWNLYLRIGDVKGKSKANVLQLMLLHNQLSRLKMPWVLDCRHLRRNLWKISGGDPVRITKGPGHNWQPDWSPDGNYIAYRSENGEGGLFIVPALGGEGLERRIASFGYQPRWSPDGPQILFQTSLLGHIDRFYVVDLNGSAPREILAEFFTRNKLWAHSAAWHHRREENLHLGVGSCSQA